MTRAQLLQLLVQQARERGFSFRKWFTASTATDWTSAPDAIAWLAQGERALLLLFSHSFARHFWRSGERVTYMVPPQTFQRVMAGGSTRIIERKAHMRRSNREDVWKFHLREMAASAEPLRYIRRYLNVQEVVDEIATDKPAIPAQNKHQDTDHHNDARIAGEDAPAVRRKGTAEKGNSRATG